VDLVNKTNYAATITTTSVAEDQMMASVIVKARFRIEHETLIPVKKQVWLFGKPVKSNFGEFEEDTPFRKQGVDVMLMGKAYPPGKGPASRSRFELQVGELNYAIDVFGDRRWVRSGGKLVASEPEPFESMPLTWEHAYGGKCPVETGDMPYHANSLGRGYYLSEETAEDGLLPNLEDPDNPVCGWQDQPKPVGVATLSRESSLRILNSIEFDTDAVPPKITKIKPSYFNNANPELILGEPPSPDTLITASGIRPGGGGISFRLPPGTFHVYVQQADRSYVFPSHLDSIIMFTEKEQVLLGFRCCFKYRLHPLERRAAVLHGGNAPGKIPEDYLIDWETFDQDEVVDV
jgi:hypothetical protein